MVRDLLGLTVQAFYKCLYNYAYVFVFAMYRHIDLIGAYLHLRLEIN